MKKGKPALFLVGLLAFFSLATTASAAVDCNIDTCITSNITATTTWATTTAEYVIQNSISIDPGVTLTINPGVIVKLTAGSGLMINGTLEADGTSGNKIYFTALKDDSVGGDTNGDGPSSPSSSNDHWQQIEIASGGSAIFDHAVVRYGGYPQWPFIRANLYNSGGDLFVSNSLIASSTVFGIRLTTGTTTVESTEIANQAFGLFQGDSNTGGAITVASSTIQGNTSYGIYSAGSSGTLSVYATSFVDNDIALMANFSDGLVFTHADNTASGGTRNGFEVFGDIATSQTWTADTMPYIPNDITVLSGKMLTIDPGAILKIPAGGVMTVVGTLIAEGSSSGPIRITALKDDLVGGDTNGDGPSVPASVSDHYQSIRINTGGEAIFNHSVLSYGGYLSYPYPQATLYNNGGILTVATSTVAHGSVYGIRTDLGTTTVLRSDIGFHDYGLYLVGGNISVMGTSTIHDNTSYGAYNATNATSSFFAQNNYWATATSSAASGPYHPTLNPSGTGDQISNYVDFDPWIGKGGGILPHYLLLGDVDCHTIGYCGSVPNGATTLILDASSTPYALETSQATSTWNALGGVNIVSATSTFANIAIYATSTDDVVWKGQWNFYQESGEPDHLDLNTYYLDSQSSTLKQHTIMHELGHALGLGHSFTGNIMYFAQQPLVTFGSQDLLDYEYLWP